MNTPYCGLCGSANIVMNDTGLFVCSDCGARFTIEAMRNLMAADEFKNSEDSHASLHEMVFRYGDAASDALVDQFEAGLYDLAATSYDRIKVNSNALDPWVILLGEMAEELNKGIEGTLYCDNAYKSFMRACSNRIDDPSVRCKLCIQALTICTTSPADTIRKQQSSAKAAAATQNYAKAIHYNVAANFTLGEIDQIRIRALIDIACCVSDGCSLRNEEWFTLKQQIEAINLTRKLPLVDRIHERLKEMVASRFVAPEYVLPASDATEQQLLDRARTWWKAGDYDLASKTYERLTSSDDIAISIEAKTAVSYLADVLDDINGTVDIYTSSMERKYKENCEKAIELGGAKGCSLLEQLISVAGIAIGVGTFYLNIARAYIQIEDKNNADEFLAKSQRYHSFTLGSYISAMQGLIAILDKEPTDIDVELVAQWKYQVDLLENIFEDDDVRIECLRSLKEYYTHLLSIDPSFQDEIETKTIEQNEERIKIDAEIADVEAVIIELVKEMASLELKQIDSRIETLESVVNQLEPDIKKRETRITEMEAKAARLESDIEANQATFDNLGFFARKKKADIKAEIEELQIAVTNLRDEIDVAINEMNAHIDEMNSAIDQIAALRERRTAVTATIENPMQHAVDANSSIVDSDGLLIELRDELSTKLERLNTLRISRDKAKESVDLVQELAEQKWQSLRF